MSSSQSDLELVQILAKFVLGEIGEEEVTAAAVDVPWLVAVLLLSGVESCSLLEVVGLSTTMGVLETCCDGERGSTSSTFTATAEAEAALGTKGVSTSLPRAQTVIGVRLKLSAGERGSKGKILSLEGVEAMASLESSWYLEFVASLSLLLLFLSKVMLALLDLLLRAPIFEEDNLIVEPRSQ